MIFLTTWKILFKNIVLGISMIIIELYNATYLGSCRVIIKFVQN